MLVTVALANKMARITSLKWCLTPPLWRIDAVGGGVHPIIKSSQMSASVRKQRDRRAIAK
jgi:hypothetical protein